MAVSVLGWLQRAWSDPVQSLHHQPVWSERAAPHLRLVTALAQRAKGEASLGGPDLVVLLRAVLRYETLALGGVFSLSVPAHVVDCVEPNDWKKASVDAESGGEGGSVRLTAHPWKPDWAEESGHTPDDPLNGQSPVRRDHEILADPTLRVSLGFQTYRSEAQREAVRAAVCASPGSTLIENMPTGSGKTLCAFLPALTHLPDGSGLLGVTPIVVPTVALALDLERRLTQFVDHPVAYRPDDKSKAVEIRSRSRAGDQGPVLVSPESLITTLRPALIAAARKGYLRTFVVDEAHMVKAWGDEFRPSFQQIAGVRRELLRETAGTLRTVLMSATLTPAHLSTLKELFGEPGPVHILHSVRLRPEPEYWRAKVSSEKDRQAVVLDALRHLPRPLILYVVKRKDATDWAKRLREEGFKRVAVMTGETEFDDRQALLEQWNADRIGVMVATSAFGLGVDKSNVQAVLHACLPEGLDRLYQEVGRGGRDGFSSLSLLVYDPKNDWGVAASLLEKKYISLERGLQRWHAMFNAPEKHSLGDNHYVVPVTVPPSFSPGDIDMASDANQAWNVRTLILMVRAKLLRIDSGYEDTKSERELIDFRGRVTVEVLDHDHLLEETWAERLEPRRKELIKENRRSKELLEEFLEGKVCVGKTLQKCYEDPALGIKVNRACAGCPVCRNRTRRRVPALRARHNPSPPEFKPLPTHGPLREWLGGDHLGLIWLPLAGETCESHEETLVALVVWLQEHGNVNLIAPQTLVEALKPSFQVHPHWVTFLHPGVPRGSAALQPTAIVLQGEVTSHWSEVWEGIHDPSSRGPWVAVLPKDMTQPDRPDRNVEDILLAPPKLTLERWDEEYNL